MLGAGVALPERSRLNCFRLFHLLCKLAHGQLRAYRCSELEIQLVRSLFDTPSIHVPSLQRSFQRGCVSRLSYHWRLELSLTTLPCQSNVKCWQSHKADSKLQRDGGDTRHA
jgi:hypothetical protein